MSITSEEEDQYRTQLGDYSDDEEATFPYSSTEEESSDGDGDDTDGGGGARRQSRPPPPFQHNFAPPFYGRPPTPLPPSPSLTSLLRPSRPTTPDASDDELEPVPRASPQVPTYEYYGFVLYLFSSLAFLIYLLWSFLPSPFLHALGIYYYPNRWWSLAVPSFLVMLIVYVYVALASYNLEVLTLPLRSLGTVVDSAGKIATVDSRGRIRGLVNRGRAHVGVPGSVATPRRKATITAADRSGRRRRAEDGGAGGGGGAGDATTRRDGLDRRKVGSTGELDWRNLWNTGTDAVMDVPLAGVCEVLYGYDAGGEDDIDAYCI